MAGIDTDLHIHFDRAEFAARRARTVASMQQHGLSALLLFRQESMYWLTGYDTIDYIFQCLVLTDDGRMALLTRAPDRLQAQFTSIIDDVTIWVDGPDAAPATELRAMLHRCGCAGKALGVRSATPTASPPATANASPPPWTASPPCTTPPTSSPACAW